MAATLTKLSASPNRLKYAFSSDGNPAVKVEIGAQSIIDDCAAGALKAALAAGFKTSHAAWAALITGPTVSVYVFPTGGTAQLLFIAWGTITGGGDGFVIQAATGAPLGALVEIVFNPTQVR
jgi:hypothetical protein